MKETIAQDLRRLFAERLHVDVPSAQTDLIETGMLDSLRLVELLLYMDSDLGWRIPLDEVDLDDLRSLERIAGLVEARLPSVARAA